MDGLFDTSFHLIQVSIVKGSQAFSCVWLGASFRLASPRYEFKFKFEFQVQGQVQGQVTVQVTESLDES